MQEEEDAAVKRAREVEAKARAALDGVVAWATAPRQRSHMVTVVVVLLDPQQREDEEDDVCGIDAAATQRRVALVRYQW